MQVLKKITPLLLSALLVFHSMLFVYAQTPAREYQVKAAFLFNFTQFVTWPDSSFPNATSPVVIGILGADPFGNYLQDLIAGEKINQHPLVIKHYSSTEEADGCRMLFINVSNKKEFQTIIEKLKGRAVLTIGESDRFAKLGGMIRLYTRNDKVNIEINLNAAKEENIDISSKLLKLSQIVTTDKN